MPSFAKTGLYGDRPSTGLIRNLVLGRLRQGQGVTQIRNALRAEGHTRGASNNAITAIAKEIRQIDRAAQGARNIRGSARPRPIQTGMEWGTRYIYHGTAHLWATHPESGREVPWEDVPVTFGDDRLLTGNEIRGRIRAIGDQVAEHGGTNVKGGPGYGDDAYVHHVTVLPTQESRGSNG